MLSKYCYSPDRKPVVISVFIVGYVLMFLYKIPAIDYDKVFLSSIIVFMISVVLAAVIYRSKLSTMISYVLLNLVLFCDMIYTFRISRFSVDIVIPLSVLWIATITMHKSDDIAVGLFMYFIEMMISFLSIIFVQSFDLVSSRIFIRISDVVIALIIVHGSCLLLSKSIDKLIDKIVEYQMSSWYNNIGCLNIKFWRCIKSKGIDDYNVIHLYINNYYSIGEVTSYTNIIKILREFVDRVCSICVVDAYIIHICDGHFIIVCDKSDKEALMSLLTEKLVNVDYCISDYVLDISAEKIKDLDNKWEVLK